MKRALLLVLIVITGILGQVPNTFVAGTAAKAGEVNANFTYLVTRLDSITLAMDSIRNLVDTMKQENTVQAGLLATLTLKNDSIMKLTEKLNQQQLAIGSIVGSMAPVDTLNGVWVLADGRIATTEYFEATGNAKVPDLRGMFLRGLNVDRADGREDPEGSERSVGSFQADALKAHSHLENLASGSTSGVYGGGSWGDLNLVQTGVTGGAESRPRNTAVYWYVKVQ